MGKHPTRWIAAVLVLATAGVASDRLARAAGSELSFQGAPSPPVETLLVNGLELHESFAWVDLSRTGPLRTAFPGRTDAPGADVSGVPREPGSVRLLSVEERSGAAVAVYQSALPSIETAARYYTQALVKDGWVLDAGLQRRDRVVGRRPGRAVVISFIRDAGRTLATVVVP